MRRSVLIIAEVGVNHNGDIDLAKELIRISASVGADVVKFQTYVGESLTTESAPKADYQKLADQSGESQLEMLQKLQLDYDDHLKLKIHAEDHGIEFLSSAFDIKSLRFLESLSLRRIKIPSGEITNLPFLKEVASINKPTILSTGMSTFDEVKQALKILTENGLDSNLITVLQCNTEYPTPPEDVNLLAMQMMQKELKLNIGLSDHTQGIEVSLAAVGLGAKVIEKHITINKDFQGPDHAASLEPDQFKKMVQSIRLIEKALGSSTKKVSNSEKKNRPIARKSIVALNKISKGEYFSESNLTTKRPGSGISPMKWDSVIGKKSKRDYLPDELIEL